MRRQRENEGGGGGGLSKWIGSETIGYREMGMGGCCMVPPLYLLSLSHGYWVVTVAEISCSWMVH